MNKKLKFAIIALIAVAIITAIYKFRNEIKSQFLALWAKLTNKNGSNGDGDGIPTLKAGTILINASDSADEFPRDWNVFSGSVVGTIISGMTYQSAPIAQEVHVSGESMQVQLTPGTYVFQVGQSGGSPYGTYSGTITDTDGKQVTFTGVMLTKGATFKAV